MENRLPPDDELNRLESEVADLIDQCDAAIGPCPHACGPEIKSVTMQVPANNVGDVTAYDGECVLNDDGTLSLEFERMDPRPGAEPSQN